MTGAERQARCRTRQRAAWLASLSPNDRVFYELSRLLPLTEESSRDINARTEAELRGFEMKVPDTQRGAKNRLVHYFPTGVPRSTPHLPISPSLLPL